MKEQKTLMDYVLRMRDNYWPDWEDLLIQKQSVLPHPTTSSTFSPTLSDRNSSNANDYSPPREVTLRSEKSLSRATTPSRSNSVGRETSSKSSTHLVDTSTTNNAHSGQVPTKPSPSPVRKANGILKQQPGLSYKPLSVNPLSSNLFTQQPQSQYNTHQIVTPETQYIPPPQVQRQPQQQMNFQSSYLETPLNYNNVAQYPMGSTIPAQHQYYNNQQVGAGFMTNNIHPLSQAPQSQYDYSALPKQDPYFEDLQRATEAVMRSTILNSNDQGNTSQNTSYWQ